MIREFSVKMDFVSGIIRAENGTVKDAPDEIRWMIGFTLEEIKPFLIRKAARVVEINTQKNQ